MGAGLPRAEYEQNRQSRQLYAADAELAGDVVVLIIEINLLIENFSRRSCLQPVARRRQTTPTAVTHDDVKNKSLEFRFLLKRFLLKSFHYWGRAYTMTCGHFHWMMMAVLYSAF